LKNRIRIQYISDSIDFRQRALIPEHDRRSQGFAPAVDRDESVGASNADRQNLIGRHITNGIPHRFHRRLPPRLGIMLGLPRHGADHLILAVTGSHQFAVNGENTGLGAGSPDINAKQIRTLCHESSSLEWKSQYSSDFRRYKIQTGEHPAFYGALQMILDPGDGNLREHDNIDFG
jgi:hypothetical protein